MKSLRKWTVFVGIVVVTLSLIAGLAGCGAGVDEAAPAVSHTAVAQTHIAELTAVAQSELHTQATGTHQAQAATETAVAQTATAHHQATATAAAQATAHYLAAEAATATAVTAATSAAELAATATADAHATATKAANEANVAASATAQAIATATAQAQATATAVALAEREGLMAQARLHRPVYGPRAGSLPHIDDDYIEVRWANVNMSDFFMEATFIVDLEGVLPRNRDIGLLFRYHENGEYRLVIALNGEWELVRRIRIGYITIESGRNLALSADGRNTLAVYVAGPTGFFFVNGQFIAELDIDGWQESGDVAVGIEFSANSGANSGATQFEAFTVWPLSEIAVAPVPQTTAVPPGFSGVALRDAMNEMRFTIEQMGGLLDRLFYGQSQSCAEYLGYYAALVNRRSFSGLPVEWQGIYSEYNFAASNIITTNNSIKQLCEGGGGGIGDLDYGIARQGIGDSLNRINQAIQGANTLLNE